MSEFANIFPAGETDWWYFEGEAGDWIDVYVDNSSVDTYLELYTSTGAYVPSQFVAWDDMAAYDRIIFRLPQTSGYLLNLTDQGPGQGAYTMYLDKLQAEANIMLIEDVAGDQGKKVRVQFDGSELDQLSGANAFDFGRWGAEAVGYQVERRKNIISNDWDNVAQLDVVRQPRVMATTIE
ncbi:MAG: PPC domain-containing protein [Melioribacteraceae bacterium]|nr:PPC domain-containing protein [Melioribacteraceae bacterium]